MSQRVRQLGVLVARHAAEVRRNGIPGAAAARVAEQREVLPGLEAERRVEHREDAELDEVVAAAARAELRPRAVLQTGRDARHVPVLVHHGVLAPAAERRPDTEARLALERRDQFARLRLEVGDRALEHRHLHPARDVDADRIRDHGVVGRQHAADRQAVALVRVGHQRARHRHRQLAGVPHLLQRPLLEPLPEDLARRGRAPRGEQRTLRLRRRHQPRKRTPHWMVRELGRGVGEPAQVALHVAVVSPRRATGLHCGVSGVHARLRNAVPGKVLRLHRVLTTSPRWQLARPWSAVSSRLPTAYCLLPTARTSILHASCPSSSIATSTGRKRVMTSARVRVCRVGSTVRKRRTARIGSHARPGASVASAWTGPAPHRTSLTTAATSRHTDCRSRPSAGGQAGDTWRAGLAAGARGSQPRVRGPLAIATEAPGEPSPARRRRTANDSPPVVVGARARSRSTVPNQSPRPMAFA